jgi:DNA mismatch repair protein MSH6
MQKLKQSSLASFFKKKVTESETSTTGDDEPPRPDLKRPIQPPLLHMPASDLDEEETNVVKKQKVSRRIIDSDDDDEKEEKKEKENKSHGNESTTPLSKRSLLDEFQLSQYRPFSLTNSATPAPNKSSSKPNLSSFRAPGSQLSSSATPVQSRSESKIKTLTKEFKEKNEDRYSWLETPKDANGNPIGHEEYDPRTLYIPPYAWNSFTPFEKQFWEIKGKHWDTVVFFKKV